MAQLRVELGDRSYSILVERGLIPRLGPLVKAVLPRARRALIITDTNVGPRFGAIARASLEQAGIATMKAKVPAGEASKSLAQAYNLYTACVSADLERSSVIIALGGGVIGDLAGYVAATYMRGIPFVQVPTTLLAQVDSSVGGKTGVDLPEGKNLVGAFHQPALVLADLDALTSLPRKELASGLAEVVKHAVIKDAGFFRFLESATQPILDLDPSMMTLVVENNCRIKAAVVGADEREGGLRAILNFGHTVGHALEAHMGFAGWRHGECVAVGMLAATLIAREVHVLQEPDLPVRLERLLQKLGLPTRLPPGVTPEMLAPLMQRDKKVDSGQIRWILPVRIGEVTIHSEVVPEIVRRSLESLRG